MSSAASSALGSTTSPVWRVRIGGGLLCRGRHRPSGKRRPEVQCVTYFSAAANRERIASARRGWGLGWGPRCGGWSGGLGQEGARGGAHVRGAGTSQMDPSDGVLGAICGQYEVLPRIPRRPWSLYGALCAATRQYAVWGLRCAPSLSLAPRTALPMLPRGCRTYLRCRSRSRAGRQGRSSNRRVGCRLPWWRTVFLVLLLPSVRACSPRRLAACCCTLLEAAACPLNEVSTVRDTRRAR